jgi:hypothetical protein
VRLTILHCKTTRVKKPGTRCEEENLVKWIRNSCNNNELRVCEVHAGQVQEAIYNKVAEKISQSNPKIREE